MIYFLVNNDYQLFDARLHAIELAKSGTSSTLIEVPHTLRSENRSQFFDAAINIKSPLPDHGWPISWPLYIRSYFEVKNRLKPTADDILIIYTEYELLNHFIVQRFKKNGARVYLLEDGGVGTYLPFSLPGNEPLNTREQIIAVLTLSLPGLGKTNFHKANGMVFPWLADHQLDGVFLYRPVKIARNIPVHVINGPQLAEVDRTQGRVIFLNECMYDIYQDTEQYLGGLKKILAALVQGFSEVLFKFHPREQAPWIERIRSLIQAEFPAVEIITDKRPVESLITEFSPEVMASYFSTALLNLDGSGIEPLFLYHLIPELANQPMFAQLTQLLNQWDYQFVSSWAEASTGYRAGMDTVRHARQLTLAEHLQTIRQEQ